MFIRFSTAIFVLAACLQCGTVEVVPKEADAGVRGADANDSHLPLPPVPACALAHPDYVERPGATELYRFIENALIDDLGSWHAAERECAVDGAHLVVLDDEEEDLFVRTTFGTSIWLGLTDAAQEGTFAWIDGTPLTYTNWATGEPSNDDDEEHFVEIRGGGKWNDIDASGGSNNHAVCECKLP